jgi:hypothetical protein
MPPLRHGEADRPASQQNLVVLLDFGVLLVSLQQDWTFQQRGLGPRFFCDSERQVHKQGVTAQEHRCRHGPGTSHRNSLFLAALGTSGTAEPICLTKTPYQLPLINIGPAAAGSPQREHF